MKKTKKKYLLSLLIIIFAIGVYIIKDDGSSSKSIQIDKQLRAEESEFYGEKGCENVFMSLNLATNSVTKKQGEASQEYEMVCAPTSAEAIKTITGDEDGKVTFKVKADNFDGPDVFTCTKKGGKATYKMKNANQKATITLYPEQQFQIPKTKDSEDKYSCNKIPEALKSRVEINIEEYIGGQPDIEIIKPSKEEIDPPLTVPNYNSYLGNVQGDNPSQPMEQNNPLVDKSEKKVQRNKYLLSDTTAYSAENNNKNKSYTFNMYYGEYEHAPSKNKYKAQTTGKPSLNDGNIKVKNIQRGDGKSISGKYINIACNYDLNATDIKEIQAKNRNDVYKSDGSGQLTPYYYDQKNTNYFYAKNEEKIGGPYQIHFNLGAYDTSRDKDAGEATCTRVCEEVVKVEYGPPIQVQAGMCFEYRVKASSIVNCYMKQRNITPVPQPGICIPAPTCWSTHLNMWMPVAGPTEEFDACIKDCDGGKYTEKCSNKCYEKVYGKDKDKNINNNKYINPTFTGNSGGGCRPGMYYRSGGAIDWCVFPSSMGLRNVGVTQKTKVRYGTEQNAKVLARSAIWYRAMRYGWYAWSAAYNTSSYDFVPGSGGIIRGHYGGGECQDGCHWKNTDVDGISCSGKYLYFDYDYYSDECRKGRLKSSCSSETRCPTYGELTGNTVSTNEINQRKICTSKQLKQAEFDYNVKIKEETEKRCKAATTCQRTQSEYRIMFNVAKEGTSEIIKSDFYSKNPATLKNGVSNNGINSYANSLLSYGGCYANTDNKNRWYQSEWTVPGSWLSLKDDSITYINPNNENNYTLQKGKVCIPRDVKTTNGEWALEYKRVSVAIKKDGTLGTTPDFKDKFDKDGKYTANATTTNGKTFPPENVYDNATKEYTGYNIFANSTNFGHFKWDFSISCFWSYTPKEKPPTGKLQCNEDYCGKDCIECICENDQCRKKDEYTIRSFDENDVLLEGKGVQPKSLDVTNSRNNIPFNWSQSATMLYMKAGGYNNNPYTDILARIRNTDTFDNSNADYVITINEQQINNIRDYNKRNGNSTIGYEFKGTFNSKNGVIGYQSKFLKDSDHVTSVGSRTLDSLRYCNNRHCSSY